MDQAGVEPAVAAANEAIELRLAFGDRSDFEDAARGLVAPLSPELVAATDGRVVWDVSAYEFLDGDRPETVNPSLWRQAQLLRLHGLFEVVEGVYQVRGLDLSNMTIVEGERGVLVIDPLISAETAAAALALYRAHRGDRPVTGLLYTHSHVDHFGGARGVVDAASVAAGEVPVLAPEGFLHHAVSENLFAGTAMSRRAAYMYGSLLEPGPEGQVTCGLGYATSRGTITLIAPTVEIVATGQTEVVDGIELEFQIVSGTEAPAEMNFLLCGQRALCVAENATRNLHNVITPRGAEVRDARLWADSLDDALTRFGGRADALFAGHQWPTWGEAGIARFLGLQRDLYAYLHDQTVRLMNRGHSGAEIAERLELPPALEREWHCRGYYGSVSHNVKGIYQRYMGWFDGNPAHLWPHPPDAAARRYVEYMGGPDAVVERARGAFADGDFRWVAEVLDHVLRARPDHDGARELAAAALTQLGYGAENATWRNFFLTGARELREGPAGGGMVRPPLDMVSGLGTDRIFAAMAIRLDGERAAGEEIAVDWVFGDVGERHAVTVSNGVLHHRPGPREGEPDATIELDRAVLDAIVAGTADLPALLGEGRIAITGDPTRLGRLFELLDQPSGDFPLVPAPPDAG
ncbi:MAG: MBL fold metallo-hydrolase [Solirubrobacterales bacterium]|nr:MBL fold metallo-hydrolase [Solirubrobacterales bacterium]